MNDGPWNTSRTRASSRAGAIGNRHGESWARSSHSRCRTRGAWVQSLATTDTPNYDSSPGDQTMIRNINVNQPIESALTPHELSTATKISKQLMKRCREAGMEGGLRFHSIGPKGRQFKHELAIVGEVRSRNIDCFASFFGAGDRNSNAPALAGEPIECVVAPEYSDAARLFIAGSSWKFDLNSINAKLNITASERTHWLRRQGFEDAAMCAGLRGAPAWQPLFLFSSVAFWSRYAVLKATKFKSYHPFGKWLKLLPTDKQFRTAVQKKRDQFVNCRLITEDKRELVSELRRAKEKSELSTCEIARRTNVSKSAISRLFNDGYGSRELAMKVQQVVLREKL